MPWVNGDVVRIEAVQTYLGSTVRNVYFYQLQNVSGTVDAPSIVTDWQVQVLSYVVQIQSASVDYVAVKLDNVTDGLSFFEVALTATSGAQSGATINSFTAYSFKLLRGSKLTRNGFKRICGVTEDNVNGNQIIQTFFDSQAYIDAANAFGDTVNVTDTSGTADFVPVIASRPTATRPGYLVQPVVDVEAQQFLTTQVSRKAGRGE